eukprot:132791-Amphidinium_carterae.1
MWISSARGGPVGPGRCQKYEQSGAGNFLKSGSNDICADAARFQMAVAMKSAAREECSLSSFLVQGAQKFLERQRMLASLFGAKPLEA